MLINKLVHDHRTMGNLAKTWAFAAVVGFAMGLVGCGAPGTPSETGGTSSAAVTSTQSSVDNGVANDDRISPTQSLQVIQTRGVTVTLETPEDLTVECDGAGNQADLDEWLASANADSSCGVLTFTNDFVALSDDCGATGSATVTWTVEDNCAEIETASGTFVIADSGAPLITGPDDLTLVCNDADFQSKVDAWLTSASASDDCGDATLEHDFAELLTPCDSIGETVTVTWTATDDCGLTAVHTATLAVFGTDTTLAINGPGDLNLNCGDADSQAVIDGWLASAVAEGTCTGIELSNDFQGLSDKCDQSGATTVTWSASDGCGNTATHTATITSADDEAPTLTGPEDLALSCADETLDDQIGEWLASATADDNCGAAELINDFGGISETCVEGLRTTTITWTATDECGQTSTHSASLILEDDGPPSLTGPEDSTVECGGLDVLERLDAWLAGAEASDACGDVELSNDFSGLSDDCAETGTATVNWTATDSCDQSATHTANFAVVDTTPPALELNGEANITLECGVDEYVEQGAAASDACDTADIEVTVAGDDVDTAATGEYVVEYAASDDCGNEGAATRTVLVEDTQPPTIADDQLLQIWPPNHKYQTFRLSDCGIEDACEAVLDVDGMGQILSIYSDEPENSNGDGNTLADIVIVSNSTFSVRSERRGGGNGRVYGVTFEVSDSAGNTLVGVCRVGVPHDQSGSQPVDDGPDAGYTVE